MTSLRFPFVTVRIELADRVFEENAILDTGFDGEIVIPQSRAKGCNLMALHDLSFQTEL